VRPANAAMWRGVTFHRLVDMGDALACTRRSITSACPPCNGHAGERSVSPEKEAGPPDGGSTRLRVSRSAPRHRTRQRGRAACQAAGAQPRGAVPAPRSGWAASPRSSGWRQTRWRRPRGAAAPPHSPPPALPATARFAARKKDPARHCPQIAPRAPARPPRAQGASTAPPAARHRQAAHRLPPAHLAAAPRRRSRRCAPADWMRAPAPRAPRRPAPHAAPASAPRRDSDPP